MLSASQAAKALGVSTARIRQLRESGALVAAEEVLSDSGYVCGYRYHESEVERVRRLRERLDALRQESRGRVVA